MKWGVHREVVVLLYNCPQSVLLRFNCDELLPKVPLVFKTNGFTIRKRMVYSCSVGQNVWYVDKVYKDIKVHFAPSYLYEDEVTAWGDSINPPVLLCHGELDTAASFRPLVQYLPKSFYYIGMEFPGHGRSSPLPPGLPINAHDMVYAIVALVRHFRWSQFMCIAHSIAALYARIYNRSYPGVMSRLVELDPAPVYSEVLTPDDFAQWYQKFFTEYYKNYQEYNTSKENAPKHDRNKALTMLMESRGLTMELAVATLDRISESIRGGLIRFTYDPRTALITRPIVTPAQSYDLHVKTLVPTLAILSEDSVQRGAYKKAPYVLENKAQNYRSIVARGRCNLHVLMPETIASSIGQFLLYGLEGLDIKAKL